LGLMIEALAARFLLTLNDMWSFGYLDYLFE